MSVQLDTLERSDHGITCGDGYGSRMCCRLQFQLCTGQQWEGGFCVWTTRYANHWLLYHEELKYQHQADIQVDFERPNHTHSGTGSTCRLCLGSTRAILSWYVARVLFVPVFFPNTLWSASSPTLYALLSDLSTQYWSWAWNYGSNRPQQYTTVLVVAHSFTTFDSLYSPIYDVCMCVGISTIYL